MKTRSILGLILVGQMAFVTAAEARCFRRWKHRFGCEPARSAKQDAQNKAISDLRADLLTTPELIEGIEKAIEGMEANDRKFAERVELELPEDVIEALANAFYSHQKDRNKVVGKIRLPKLAVEAIVEAAQED